jgi:hypothetical protein
MQWLLISLRISGSALVMLVEITNGIAVAGRSAKGQIELLGSEGTPNLLELSVRAML